MPITVGHSDPTIQINAAAESRRRRDSRILEQREYSTGKQDAQNQLIESQTASRNAFKEQEGERNRQQQFDMMDQAHANRQEDAQAKEEMHKIQMLEEYQAKDDYEKKQLEKQRSGYVHEKEALDKAYAGGKGKISYSQWADGNVALGNKYDPMVSTPFYKDLKRAAEEADSVMTVGNDHNVQIMTNPKTGQLDRAYTRQEKKKEEQEDARIAQLTRQHKDKMVMDALAVTMKTASTQKDAAGNLKPFDALEYTKKAMKVLPGIINGEDAPPPPPTVEEGNDINGQIMDQRKSSAKKRNTVVNDAYIDTLAKRYKAGETLSDEEMNTLKDFVNKGK